MIGIVVTQIAAAALVTQSGPSTFNETPVAIARAFLEAFATNPAAAKSLFTTDGVAGVGEFSGPANEFMDGVRSQASWMASCRITSLLQKPAPSAAELDSRDPPPWVRGGNFAFVEGSYSCTEPNGKEAEMQVSFVLQDARVAMFHLAPKH